MTESLRSISASPYQVPAMLTSKGPRWVNCSTHSAVLTFTESGSEKNKEEYLRGSSARNLKRGPAPPLEYHPFIIEYDSGSAIGRDAVDLETGWGKNPRKKSQGENCIQIERGFIYVSRVRRCLNMIEHDGEQAMPRIVKMTRRLGWDGMKKIL